MRNLEARVDRFFRGNTALPAKICKRINPIEGPGYSRSARKREFDQRIAGYGMKITAPIEKYLVRRNLRAEPYSDPYYVAQRLGVKEGIAVMIPVKKIRTMVEGADTMPYADPLNRGDKRGDVNDPRITPFGRILRITGLDEIPQIRQIKHGEMSLVGPRISSLTTINAIKAQRPDLFNNWKQAYLDGMPGLVSLYHARAKDIHEKDERKRVRYDKLYAQKASLGLDLYILSKVGIKIARQMIKRAINKVR